MNTLELTIYVGEDWQELLIAELADLDFDTFFQEESNLKAYIAAPRWTDVKREQIEHWLLTRGIGAPIEEKEFESTNWNRQWEETIQPIVVEPFLIKPTWAATPPDTEDLIVLEIDPKMSFGTGYHESTRICLRLLPRAVVPSGFVLDAGTGTGILAIAALKLGAASAVTFDIDEWAQLNAVENFLLNGMANRIVFRPGSFEVVPEEGFDLILANIQRNVLIDMMPEFSRRLVQGGFVLISGLLLQDGPVMIETASRFGLTCTEQDTEGEWWGAILTKS